MSNQKLPDEAIRFGRREDAQRYAQVHLGQNVAWVIEQEPAPVLTRAEEIAQLGRVRRPGPLVTQLSSTPNMPDQDEVDPTWFKPGPGFGGNP